MELKVPVTVFHEQGSFWSEIDRLPGCFASGTTLSELHEALGEAIGVYLWDEPARLVSGQLAVGVNAVCVADASEEPHA
ncbi:MAG: hypothetical protein M3Y09_20915 [Actinomycetota bacterium]|nr:hypothetical protein [Actinomycetota bacterium]